MKFMNLYSIDKEDIMNDNRNFLRGMKFLIDHAKIESDKAFSPDLISSESELLIL